MSNQATPVHIVTGFLGAGKTSFLNHWIRSKADERIMVIENEVGAVNLDSQWIVGTEISPVPLTAGCLCCSLHSELIDVLEELGRRRDSFDSLVIETTGVADPESLAMPFLTMGRVERDFKLQNIICLVDAGNFEHWLTQAEEAKRQVAFADVLLINKIDTLEEDQVSHLIKVLHEINPQAEVWTGKQGEFPVAELREVYRFEGQGAVDQYEQMDTNHQAENHGITTFSLSFDQPFDLRGLSQTLMQLLTINRHQIYRIKGILNAQDYPVQVVLQSVYRTFILSDGMLWPADEPRVSKVVIIGKKLEKEALRKVFARHLLGEKVG